MSESFKKMLSISLILFFSNNLIAREIFGSGIDVIYGKDDRVEIEQYSDSDFIEKSQSIAMKVSKRRLTTDRNDPTRVLFPNLTLKSVVPQICETERFIDQISLGTCSGFLVGPKTLVTAGHCVLNEDDCKDNKWIFGFKEGISELNSSQVYSCSKIKNRRYEYSEKEVSDYAVIELDRAVEGYVPLKTRKFGRVLINTPLVVIGHPMGLPMKATDGGVVSRFNDIEKKNKLRSFILRSHYFNANLDAYGGNSGSPVFNRNTGKIEGILIQGAEDFVFNPARECLESKVNSNSHLKTYEKVMRINKIPGL